MPTGGGECGCSQDGGKRKKKAVSKKRRLTNYNKFMRNEIQKVKKEYPKLTHQEAFKKAAGNWKGKK
jgi:hypothetical protein